MSIGVYLITERATGRKYVGKSRRLEARRTAHARGNSSGEIGKVVAAHGWAAFDYAVIETCSLAALDEAEARWIAHHDCLTPKGFNRLKPGGREAAESEGGNGARRQARLRLKGRQIACVLRDPKAIKALDQLTEKHGGVTAAVSAALVHAEASKSTG